MRISKISKTIGSIEWTDTKSRCGEINNIVERRLECNSLTYWMQCAQPIEGSHRTQWNRMFIAWESKRRCFNHDHFLRLHTIRRIQFDALTFYVPNFSKKTRVTFYIMNKHPFYNDIFKLTLQSIKMFYNHNK